MFRDFFIHHLMTNRISLFCVLADPRETRRIDTYLAHLFPHTSRAYMQKLIEDECVSVNNVTFSKNKKIYRGDVIEVRWKIEKMHIEAEDLPLDILFENEDFAIVNKDPGVNTHPTPWEDGKSGTLVNALLHHFKNLSVINGVERPWIVHRLDKDTSWLLIIAKNDKSMHALQLKIAKRTIQKTYLALVAWKVRDNEGYIESFIGRDPTDRKRMTALDPVNPKLAQTKFKKIREIDDKYTLLEVDLLTGRTHQIRVHLASIGYPIIGDKTYGNEKMNKEAFEKYGLTRQWLHAWKLSFNLFWKDYNFEWNLKEDIKSFIDK